MSGTAGKFAFFRQSGWLVLSTVICGVFLMLVLSLVQRRLSTPDFGTFLSMLRFFTILGIVTSGLQVAMAQQAAAALTPEAQRELRLTTHHVALVIFAMWLCVLVVCLVWRQWLMETFKLPEVATLLVTLGLVLAQLFLPFTQGLLQGQQQFSWLGASLMVNGIGRFAAIYLLMRQFARDATTALSGALAGLAGAVLIAAWPSRGLFLRGGEIGFRWKAWLGRALPLTMGSGSLLFLMNADVLFVQAHFSRDDAAYYSAVAVLGIGLVSFTTPMAAVMFPKLVRSVAQSQRSDSLLLALSGTLLLGLMGAIVLTVFPTLPLRILYFKDPRMLKCATLVPWFMWSMLPMTLANVMVGNLLARRDFRAVPVFLLIAILYGFELNRYLGGVQQVELFAAFKGVIFRLGTFSALMLGIAVLFSARPPAVRSADTIVTI
jgi:O-antigen/teichoic acid export membrane protein